MVNEPSVFYLLMFDCSEKDLQEEPHAHLIASQWNNLTFSGHVTIIKWKKKQTVSLSTQGVQVILLAPKPHPQLKYFAQYKRKKKLWNDNTHLCFVADRQLLNKWWHLPISNPEPDLYNMKAHRFYGATTHALSYAVVYTRNLFSPHEGFLTHQRNISENIKI